jgi:hypothetical protein
MSTGGNGGSSGGNGGTAGSGGTGQGGGGGAGQGGGGMGQGGGGMGQGGGGGMGQGGGGGMGQGGMGQGGGGGSMCIKCSDILINQGGNPNNLCTSSVPIFTALQTCVCQTNCSNQCGNTAYCGGMGMSGQCNACVQQNCASEAQACYADM